MKEHLFREMVNSVRDIAIQYHNHQSLRDRLARVMASFVYENRPTDLKKPMTSNYTQLNKECE